jgi:hypothetical protein
LGLRPNAFAIIDLKNINILIQSIEKLTAIQEAVNANCFNTFQLMDHMILNACANILLKSIKLIQKNVKETHVIAMSLEVLGRVLADKSTLIIKQYMKHLTKEKVKVKQ